MSPPTACKHLVSGSISLPLSGFFSPFPHGTCALSVIREYLGLEDGPPTFRQGFTCPALLKDLRLFTCTRLSLSLARLSILFQLSTLGHWPVPRSLVTTNGVSFDVLSSSYLDISVHWVCSQTLCIHVRVPDKQVGSPIQISSDQRLLASPRGFSQRATSFIAF